MSSRGAYVAGTDGTDFQHRERVASQYAVSATNKYRLKVLVVLHYLLGAAHLLRLAPSLLDISLPAPTSLIELAWLLSLPASRETSATSSVSASCARNLARLKSVVSRRPNVVVVVGCKHLCNCFDQLCNFFARF